METIVKISQSQPRKKFYLTPHARKRMIQRGRIGVFEREWRTALTAYHYGHSPLSYEGDLQDFLNKRMFNNLHFHGGKAQIKVFGGLVFFFAELPTEIVVLTVVDIPPVYSEVNLQLRDQIKRDLSRLQGVPIRSFLPIPVSERARI